MPIYCEIESLSPATRHYDIRFICHRTGLHYCWDHVHPDSCCVPLASEFAYGNEIDARKMLAECPKCPLCKVPMPKDLAKEHLIICASRFLTSRPVVVRNFKLPEPAPSQAKGHGLRRLKEVT